MTRSTIPLPRFNVGEVDPKLWGRVDLPQYSAAAKQALNVTVTPQGAIQRRGGTRFVAGAKDHRKKSRLVPFVYSNEDAYVFEFGDRYIRFFYRGGQLVAESVATRITNGDFTDNIDGWEDASVDAIDDPIDPSIPETFSGPPSAVRNLECELLTPFGMTEGTAIVQLSWDPPSNTGATPILNYFVTSLLSLLGTQNYINTGLSTSLELRRNLSSSSVTSPLNFWVFAANSIGLSEAARCRVDLY